MMWKKWIAGALAAATVFSFAACTKAPEDVRGNVEPGQTEASTAPEDVRGDVESGEAEFSTGTSSGSKYENKFIGIGCELDSNWVLMSDAEMQEVNKASQEMVGGEYQKMMEQAEVVYDMMATNVNETDTVNVNLEKLSGIARLIDESDYVEQSLASLSEPLESMGIENVQMETGEMEFAGATHKTVSVEGDFMGIKVYEKLVCVKCSGYMAVVTVCTWQENTTDQVLESFYAV